jgi:hypothetical protein
MEVNGKLHPDAVWRKRVKPTGGFGDILGVPVAALHAHDGKGGRWVQPMAFHCTTGPAARGHWESNGLPTLVAEEDLWPQTYLGGL